MNDDSVKIHGTEAEMTEAMDNNQTLEDMKVCIRASRLPVLSCLRTYRQA